MKEGAYAGATYLVAEFLNAPLINSYGFFCYLLLLVLWVVVFVRTLVGVGRREFF